MTMKKQNSRKAFTIVELVVVIAVIAVLAVVLVPTFSDVIAKSQDSKALQEAKNAYTNYVAENDGKTPEFMVYQLGGRFVALHNGAPIGVFVDEASALGAMMDAYDINNLADTGDGKLWVYGTSGFGNEENEPTEVVGDSLSFTPIPEAEEFVKNSTLPILRIFYGAYRAYFERGKTFQDCLEECQYETYAMCDYANRQWYNPSHYLSIDYSTGEVIHADRDAPHEAIQRAGGYALSVLALFEATPATAHLTSIEIEELYCFSDPTEGYSLRFYIVTNQGAYVYFEQYDVEYTGYLMPESYFYELKLAGYSIYDWPEKYEEYLVGEVDLDK
jgi:type IV pilus assembly protein PilA